MLIPRLSGHRWRRDSRENKYTTYNVPNAHGTIVRNWSMDGNKQWMYIGPELNVSRTMEGLNNYYNNTSFKHVSIALPPILLSLH
jgi:hypothetical protein